MFHDTVFPNQWRTATVIAFPKPGKDHSDSNNYRPIALTNCIVKTLERIVNRRLYEYLIMHKKISPVQCGCRRNRSTTDHLVRLETSIRTAFVHREHMIRIFFDLLKAYDATWKYWILSDLYDMGLKRRLLLFIQQFLCNRSFRVIMGQHLSDWYTQEEGVPQGCVLSVTLFAVKVNQLGNIIPSDPKFLSSLYVDDFQLSYRDVSLVTVGRKL